MVSEARRYRVVWVLAGLLLPVLSAAALAWWTGIFDHVRSSSGSFTSGIVYRILLFDDFRVAAWASQIPKVYYDNLYPILIALVSRTPLGELLGGPVVVGHVLAAAALGLAALPLFALWRAVGGGAAGVAGAAALLFPPMVTTAALIRADNLSAALALLCAWTALWARRRGHWACWGLAGLLAGLIYVCREFYLGPALGGLGVAALLHVLEARRDAGDLGALLRLLWPAVTACVVGVLVGATLLPLALGHSPLVGVDAILQYGKTGPPSGEDFYRQWYAALYLDTHLVLPLALGLVGLILCAVRLRGPRREAALVLLGMVLPYGAFATSAQQSPQYYLLLHVLLLSGLAGLLALVPWMQARVVVATCLVALAVWWTATTVPTMLGLDRRPWPYYSEAWPAPHEDVLKVTPWAMAQVKGAPLIFTGESLEHFREYLMVNHRRPLARVYPGDPVTQYRHIANYYGKRCFVLSVTNSPYHPTVPGAEAVGFRKAGVLEARLMRVDPDPKVTAGVDAGLLRGRGIMQQGAWLDGGDARLRSFAAGRAAGRTSDRWFSPFADQ